MYASHLSLCHCYNNLRLTLLLSTPPLHIHFNYLRRPMYVYNYYVQRAAAEASAGPVLWK